MKSYKYKIIGTLEYGKMFSKKWLILWDIIHVLLVIVIVLFVVDSFQSSSIHKVINPAIIVCALVFVVSLFLRLSLGALYKINKKTITLCEKDAVLTYGTLKCIEFGGMRRKYQITVKYKKGEIAIISPSENLHKIPFRMTRYLYILHNSTMPVLYSHEFKQVLLVEITDESIEIM